ncbi:hypothetical protein [Serinibacter arcticus]|uniref:Uncharacterized protein n=1 Tax=Serinibacter arcticus TaxID=1655435 RepID=A0A4Z1E229_9MICO|nr:hypothetical protein [Serinibacter arcticus]TGO03877.1 hypothetical protein SERN_2889 [Serinibacter arcticus]
MRARPTRTLLSPSVTGTRTGTTAAQASVAEAPGAAPRPTFQQLPPAELHAMLADHGLLGRRLGRLLGVTTTWATTRWAPGPVRGTVVPTFHIRVPGACPDRAAGEQVTQKLQRQGWRWRLVADRGSFRVDAKRQGASIAITARDNTIGFTVQGAPVAIGPTQARLLMAGVYDDD